MDSSEMFAYGGVPTWMHDDVWLVPVKVKKQPKIELKVYMCCLKCEEIVNEEIREVEGVVDVKIDTGMSKVTVFGKPDSLRVLKKARKVDKRAKFWDGPDSSKENTKEENTSASTSWSPSDSSEEHPQYKPSQHYPPHHYPNYPETDYSNYGIMNPNYLKHIQH